MGVIVGYPWTVRNYGDLDRAFQEYPEAEERFWKVWVRASHIASLRVIRNQTNFHFDIGSANAFYSTGWNKVVVTAGMLHAPVFFKDGPSSFNYGALGTVSFFFFRSSPAALSK